MIKTLRSAVICRGHTLSCQRTQTYRLRYLNWLPVIFLAACASQTPLSAPPIESAAPVFVPAPIASPVAPAAEVAPAPRPQGMAIATAEKIATLRAWVDQQNRLLTIAAPLLLSNTPLCKQHVQSLLGLVAKNKYSYTDEFAEAAQLGLGLGEQLQVTHVMPGSGASQSGVRQGDILLAAGDKPLPQGPGAERKAGGIVRAIITERPNVKLTVLRGGERFNIKLPLTQACAFDIELGNADEVNSYADGHRAMVTRGMLDFTQSDQELAYVIAKEFAHNILTRSARPRMRALIANLRQPSTNKKALPATIQLAPYSPVLDATADKLSLYLLARAGYPINDVLAFWKRLAAQFPSTVQNSHTALHPATAYRFSVMTQIVRTIKLKNKNGLPLLP